MTVPAGYKLRVVNRDDHNSIFSDWLRSGRKCKATAGVASQIYFFWQHLTIERLLDPEAKCTWLVACSVEDPTKIYGWVCGQRADSIVGDQAIAHYVYVKRLYRRLGIARRLLNALQGEARMLVVTSLTDSGRALLHSRPHVYNPYLQAIYTPSTAPKHKSGHPHAVSRRALSTGGYVPADGIEEPDDGDEPLRVVLP
jgi:GNAT superfamily N-acetyltransferase